MKELVITVVTVLIGNAASIIVNLISNSKSDALQTERISVLQSDIKTLSSKVEAHNNYGLQLAKIETRLDALERKG